MDALGAAIAMSILLLVVVIFLLLKFIKSSKATIAAKENLAADALQHFDARLELGERLTAVEKAAELSKIEEEAKFKELETKVTKDVKILARSLASKVQEVLKRLDELQDIMQNSEGVG